MTVYQSGGSLLGFGEQASPSVVAATKNRWLGTWNADPAFPFPETEVEEMRGGAGTLDPVRLHTKLAKLGGNLDLTLVHAWPLYWLLGGSAQTGAGPYTRTFTGSNQAVYATLHQILGKDDGTQDAIDWIGCVPNGKSTYGVKLGEALKMKTPYAALDFNEAATPVSVSAVDREPYKWDGAEWYFYEPGTTTPLTHDGATSMTTPAVLEDWEGETGGDLDQMYGQRSSNAHLPVRYTKMGRGHGLKLGIVPEADMTLFKALVKNRRRFDFLWKTTRGANDTIQFLFQDCYTTSAPKNPTVDAKAYRVPVAVTPRKVTVTTVNSYSTLLAEA